MLTETILALMFSAEFWGHGCPCESARMSHGVAVTSESRNKWSNAPFIQIPMMDGEMMISGHRFVSLFEVYGHITFMQCIDAACCYRCLT